MKPGLASQVNKPTVHQIIGWAAWVSFLLFAVAACLFGQAEKRDVYFIRRYDHYTMDRFTAFMTSYSVWMLAPPFLWLPFVMAYQCQDHPKWATLLFLVGTMFMACMSLAVLLLCAGPPIQM